MCSHVVFYVWSDYNHDPLVSLILIVCIVILIIMIKYIAHIWLVGVVCNIVFHYRIMIKDLCRLLLFYVII